MGAKDFLGADLQVGDWLVYLEHSRTSSKLIKGEVIKITEKMLTVKGASERRVSFDKVVKINSCVCGSLGVAE